MKIHILLVAIAAFFLIACSSIDESNIDQTVAEIDEVLNDEPKQTDMLTDSNHNLTLANNELNIDMFSQNFSNVLTKRVNEPLGLYARPNDSNTYPGVVMIHEWWGLNDNIEQMAQILANEGYQVFAVDLYNGEVAENASKARELAMAARSDVNGSLLIMRDAVQYLRNQNAQKVASLGWCFGGQQSLALSLNEDLDATVIYYGNLVTNASELQSISQPVLGIFAEEDGGIPPSVVREFEASLNQIGVTNDMYIYPGVDHAFANPSGDRYAPEETADAWMKTTAFLAENLQ